MQMYEWFGMLQREWPQIKAALSSSLKTTRGYHEILFPIQKSLIQDISLLLETPDSCATY